MAAGAFSFVPDIEVEATSDKLRSSVTEAVILLASSSSGCKKIEMHQLEATRDCGGLMEYQWISGFS